MIEQPSVEVRINVQPMLVVIRCLKGMLDAKNERDFQIEKSALEHHLWIQRESARAQREISDWWLTSNVMMHTRLHLFRNRYGRLR